VEPPSPSHADGSEAGATSPLGPQVQPVTSSSTSAQTGLNARLAWLRRAVDYVRDVAAAGTRCKLHTCYPSVFKFNLKFCRIQSSPALAFEQLLPVPVRPLKFKFVGVRSGTGVVCSSVRVSSNPASPLPCSVRGGEPQTYYECPRLGP
jgi:hypothetical protein